jgi:hypothetical protein
MTCGGRSRALGCGAQAWLCHPALPLEVPKGCLDSGPQGAREHHCDSVISPKVLINWEVVAKPSSLLSGIQHPFLHCFLLLSFYLELDFCQPFGIPRESQSDQKGREGADGALSTQGSHSSCCRCYSSLCRHSLPLEAWRISPSPSHSRPIVSSASCFFGDCER